MESAHEGGVPRCVTLLHLPSERLTDAVAAATVSTMSRQLARSKSVMPGEAGAGVCRPGSPKSMERPLKTGWLKKQRSIVKNWQLRYFMLRGHTLYYYKDDKDSAFQGHINLRSSQVNELPSNADDPGKFLFEIIPGSSGDRERDPYVLMANSQNEMEEWVRTIRRVIGVPASGAVFGKSLSDTVTYEQRFGPHLVPFLVQKCAEFIREHGLNEEGIFRLPGQDNQVKQFRDAFDAGERPSFPSDTDVHTVASLFKLYLRELPEPGREPLEKQIALLPRANYNLLSYICRFLYEIQQNSKVNKMSVENLATVIGVNLLKPQIEDPVTMMKGTPQIQKLMTVMIRQHEDLFPPSKDVAPSPPSKNPLLESAEEDGLGTQGGESIDGEGSEVATSAQPSQLAPSSSSGESLGTDPWTGSPRKRTQTLPALGVCPGRVGGSGVAVMGLHHQGSLRAAPSSPPLPPLDSDGGKGTLSEDIFKALDLQRVPLFTSPRAGSEAERGDSSDGAEPPTPTTTVTKPPASTTTVAKAIPTKPSRPAQPLTQPPQKEIRVDGGGAKGPVPSIGHGAQVKTQGDTQGNSESLINSLQQRNSELVATVTELQAALEAEKRLVAALEIRLRNAERSRDEAQRRNLELDKEIQEFLTRAQTGAP
ncbi:hypothetical protein JZ751_013840 [Albula glossodonta]|uniref:Rho GTPase activating protein 25 n=1 Tax=Albula glossodonta TaxID=121402 RepID=A0A8T2MY45_9TELE|nr:hypothetical protein JZ751_013840 [Albula glossodonta]